MTTATGYDRRSFLRAGAGVAAAGASAGAAATGVASAQENESGSGNQSGGGNESGGQPGGPPGSGGSGADGQSLVLFLVAGVVAFLSPLGLAALLFARRSGDGGRDRGRGRKYGD